jgi:serine protease Do
MLESQGAIERHPRSRAIRSLVLVCALSSCVAATTAFADAGAVQQAKEMGEAFSEVAHKVTPGVVFVRVEKKVSVNPAASQQGLPNFFGDDFLRHFFGNGSFSLPQEQFVEGQGSGFIISDDGYILTNNHVISGAEKVLVKLPDEREFTAKIVGADPHSDVAVIKIDADHLPALQLGNSDKLDVGEWVLALGNPFGLTNTLTAGIVSAKGRSRIGLADYEDFIQTDAAINPGNSGGPLVDMDGEVIGMNTAIFTRSGGYMGVGLAIPINMVSQIEKQLVEHGSVERGFLGILIQDLTPELAESFDLGQTQGILISEVTEGSPADKAGLERGDVILELDGQPVGKTDQFRNRVAFMSPGSKVDLTILRKGKRESIAVTLGRHPEEQAEAGTPAAQEDLGLTVQNLTPELAEQFGYVGQTGVLVTDVKAGSAAAMAGIQPGMLIQEVNRRPVSSLAELQDALDHPVRENSTLLLVRDEQGTRYVVVQK